MARFTTMRRRQRHYTAAALAAAFALPLLAAASPHLSRRAVTTNAEDLNGQLYDYVIVGGGTAGLVLANRLSASRNTVAVIEAGGSGDDVIERILTPAMTYLEGVSVPGSVYDWGYFTDALGRSLHWPRGKILGGSSAINALYLVRASKIEHDAWAALNPGADQDWSWDGLFPYMKLSESYTPPSSENITAASIQVNADYHGRDGPLHSSYPAYVYDQIGAWVPTLQALNVTTRDPQGGEGWGAYITPNSINPSNQARSYSKNAYLDPVNDRPNLVVLLGNQATKINFQPGDNGAQRAVSVEYSPGGQARYTVRANREVIVAAGVIGTPTLLQHSGVGPRALLERLNITVVHDLPGVGEHLQDHVLVPLVFTTNASITGDLTIQDQNFRNEQLDLYRQGRFSESLYTAPNNAIAYVDLRQLMGDERAGTFVNELRANKTPSVNGLGGESTVMAGFDLTYQTELDRIIDSDVGVIELLMGNTGNFNPTEKTIGIQAAIQHPFSRGRVQINSTDPFQTPIITSNYLTHPADMIVLVEGVKYARRVAQTEPLASFITGELRPGPDIQTDDQIAGYVWDNGATQYHPASTSSQLPLNRGGVVDTSLRVYGTQGLRVIDSSIIPIGLCAHLMGPTFAIAEKGAAIVLANETPQLVPGGTNFSASLALRSSWTFVASTLSVVFVLLRLL